MDLVLDASTTIAWALNESDRLAARTWERMKGDQALVRTLWWFELRNALVVNERRGRITEQQTARFLSNVERAGDDDRRHAGRERCSDLGAPPPAYCVRCCYLELAVRNALPLATLDAMLATAARSEGAPLFGHDAG